MVLAPLLAAPTLMFIALVPMWVAIACAIPALALKPQGPDALGSGGRVDARVGSVVVIAIVGAALLAADVFGPGVAGIVAAFPTLSATFVLLLVRARGREAGACALAGLIVGLRGYLAFCVLVAATGSVLFGLVGVAAMNLLAARSLNLHVTSA